jgi:hypothetical protein
MRNITNAGPDQCLETLNVLGRDCDVSCWGDTSAGCKDMEVSETGARSIFQLAALSANDDVRFSLF